MDASRSDTSGDRPESLEAAPVIAAVIENRAKEVGIAIFNKNGVTLRLLQFVGGSSPPIPYALDYQAATKCPGPCKLLRHRSLCRGISDIHSNFEPAEDVCSFSAAHCSFQSGTPQLRHQSSHQRIPPGAYAKGEATSHLNRLLVNFTNNLSDRKRYAPLSFDPFVDVASRRLLTTPEGVWQ